MYERMVFSVRRLVGMDAWSCSDVRNRYCHLHYLVRIRPVFRMVGHVAACNQHRDDGNYVFDAVRLATHAEQRYTGFAFEAR